jgi:hypothetical protein
VFIQAYELLPTCAVSVLVGCFGPLHFAQAAASISAASAGRSRAAAACAVGALGRAGDPPPGRDASGVTVAPMDPSAPGPWYGSLSPRAEPVHVPSGWNGQTGERSRWARPTPVGGPRKRPRAVGGTGPAGHHHIPRRGLDFFTSNQSRTHTVAVDHSLGQRNEKMTEVGSHQFLRM